jgi:arylsulfatase A
LNNDPYEKNNLSKQEPELVERLDKEITHWAESVYSEVPDQFARKVQRTNKK